MGFLLAGSGVQGQTIESAVMPGPVVQGHAELEVECKNCHVRFDRAAQSRLCLSCHKPTANDMNRNRGYHGRLKNDERDCRTCHTDHKGRTAKIMVLEEKRFDHTQTDFALLGKHRGKPCKDCHGGKPTYRQAPSECVACHRKDDKHKNGLGSKCDNCHNESSWKDARFDHGKTKFPLRLGHAASSVECTSCHVEHKYSGTAPECVACHRDDDLKKGHKGHFGNRCEKCHDEGEWQLPVFRHERDTRYPLLDRHRQVKCASCHTTPLYGERTPTRCASCHRDDDVHKNSLGDRCDTCHSARGWKSTRFDHDADTRFALRDKHRSAKCESCHKDKDKGLREKLAMTCISCHDKDDREKGHRGSYGTKCETCHNAKAFKPATFDHGRDTAFTLSGRHSKVTCASCHRTPLYEAKLDAACYGCHKKEDVHFATYGLDCERCHVSDDWRRIIKNEEKTMPPKLEQHRERVPPR